MKYNLSIIHDAKNVRDILRKNPNLPVVVLAGDEANCGDYNFMYCSRVECNIGEILDCETPFGEEGLIFCDHGEFEEALSDYLSDIPEPKFTEVFERELEKYEPYWTKAIIIWVDN